MKDDDEYYSRQRSQLTDVIRMDERRYSQGREQEPYIEQRGRKHKLTSGLFCPSCTGACAPARVLCLETVTDTQAYCAWVNVKTQYRVIQHSSGKIIASYTSLFIAQIFTL